MFTANVNTSLRYISTDCRRHARRRRRRPKASLARETLAHLREAVPEVALDQRAHFCARR